MAWIARGSLFWCPCALSVFGALLFWGTDGIRMGTNVNSTSASNLAEDGFYQGGHHVTFASELADGPPMRKKANGRADRCEPVLGTDTDLAACRAICRAAVGVVPQPVFPLHFFGGLKIQKRSKVKTAQDMLTQIGACTIPGGRNRKCLQVQDLKMESTEQWIKLGDIDGSENGEFAYPLHALAYFSCYTRTKLPLFKTWLVDPALQEGEYKKREGDFKNPARDDPLHEAYHSNFKDEFLRSGDVIGVWSEYFAFDQGHWAPDAPFRRRKEIVATTYYYINVSPQTACLNRGNWEGLEAQVRELAVTLKTPIQVISGPLRQLPDIFVKTVDQRKKWKDLFEFWRVASEVLMEDSSEIKDPHWMEVTWTNDDDTAGHCILRGARANEARDKRFPDFVSLPTCSVPKITTRQMLHRINLFLMTEAGAYKARRGVQVPLGYWKVITLPSDMYCCWLMDQTDEVAPVSGAACLATIRASSWGTQAGELNIFHPSLKYAGAEYCRSVFTRNPKRSVNCDFHEIGIGWRGAYLLREAE